MIKEKDLNKELGIIDDYSKKEENLFKKGLLKVLVLITKMLRDIRSNLVGIMKKIGAELREAPKRPTVVNNSMSVDEPAKDTEVHKEPEKEA